MGIIVLSLCVSITNELGVNCKVTSDPMLDKPGSLAGILTNLEENDGKKSNFSKNKISYKNKYKYKYDT